MSLSARPVAGVAEKGLDWKPVIQPVQDSTPDGQPMEGTTYLEHSALGVSLDSGLMEGMSCKEPLEQSVLGECLVTRPEGTDTPERPALASRTDHEETCLKLSARPIPDTDIVYNADVSTDVYTDLLENSAPRIISDIVHNADVSTDIYIQTCWRIQSDEFSDTSRTDTAELEELDSRTVS